MRTYQTPQSSYQTPRDLITLPGHLQLLSVVGGCLLNAFFRKLKVFGEVYIYVYQTR